jgi:phenol hydroxylase P1 protein
MPYEIRLNVIPPQRVAFKELEEALKRPPNRYEEAVLFVQQKENFHYRPAYAPDKEIYDPAYTKLRMRDYAAYYTFLDPQQYYYFTYCSARARSYEILEKDLELAEERQLFCLANDQVREVIASYLPQLRHYEWGASIVAAHATRFSYGTSIESRFAFEAFDRYGNAQTIGKVLLRWKQNEQVDLLSESKQRWLGDEPLQPLRKMIEHLWVVTGEDWAEAVFGLALLDAIVYPLLFRGLDDFYLRSGAMGLVLLNRHFYEFYVEKKVFIQTLFRTFLGDIEHGGENKKQLAAWAAKWQPMADAAFQGLARLVEGVGGSPHCERDEFLSLIA